MSQYFDIFMIFIFLFLQLITTTKVKSAREKKLILFYLLVFVLFDFISQFWLRSYIYEFSPATFHIFWMMLILLLLQYLNSKKIIIISFASCYFSYHSTLHLVSPLYVIVQNVFFSILNLVEKCKNKFQSFQCSKCLFLIFVAVKKTRRTPTSVLQSIIEKKGLVLS